MKIIFIEGISGVGKSTTTQKLYDKLCKARFSVDRYLEFDFPNPIDFYATAYFKLDDYNDMLEKYDEFSESIERNAVVADDIRLVRYYNQETPLFHEPLLGMMRKHEFCWKPTNVVSLSEYTRVFKSVWERFAQNESSQMDYLIFDGSLIHHPINDMMRNYNADIEQISHHLNTLIEAVSSLRPKIIYLSSDNVAERLRKARISRQQTSLSNGQILFWEERKKMDLDVIQRLSIPCNIYDITQENWDEHIDSIFNNCIK